MQHAFLVYCHTEVEQTRRLRSLLAGSFPGSAFHVYHDGPEPWPNRADTDVTPAAFQPDKCRGILQGLNGLVGWANFAGMDCVSFLHPDMVPTDQEQFSRFWERFLDSGKILTFAPMLPGHRAPSFITLHFRLPEALGLFPLGVADAVAEANHRVAEQWYNEAQTLLSWEDTWPHWQDYAYPMALMTVPYRNQYHLGSYPIEKLVHGDGYEYAFNDFCPESSVIHTHDQRFWENADVLIR